MADYQRALITGATSGIGAAFADYLPETTELMLVGRNEDRLAKAKARLAVDGRRVETVPCDLADEAAVGDLIERADRFGVDLLINNAGVGHLGRIIDNPAAAERETVMVNVAAVVALTRGLLPGMIMRARRDGRRAGVIIVSSTAAFAPVPYFGVYAASKVFELYFAEALTEELAAEPAHILALCPGATRTEFGSRAGFEGGALPGAADPADVAREAMMALGRRPVHTTGLISQAAFGPLLASRRLVTGVLGMAMRLVTVCRDRSVAAARPPTPPSGKEAAANG
jgi:hypothetical protein